MHAFVTYVLTISFYLKLSVLNTLDIKKNLICINILQHAFCIQRFIRVLRKQLIYTALSGYLYWTMLLCEAWDNELYDYPQKQED